MTGFASATQDIAADGVYISSMDHKEQARSSASRGSSGTSAASSHPACWSRSPACCTITCGSLGPRVVTVMGILAAVMGLAFVWHLRVLPGRTSGRAPASVGAALRTFGDACATFFQKPSIWLMLAMVFFYRFGEGFIEKIGPLFLLDSRAVGGLGLDNVQLGNINGTFGTVAFSPERSWAACSRPAGAAAILFFLAWRSTCRTSPSCT